MITQIVTAEDYYLQVTWQSPVGTLMQFKHIPVWAVDDGQVVPMVYDFQDDHLVPVKEWKERFSELEGVEDVEISLFSAYELECVDEEEEEQEGAEWGG